MPIPRLATARLVIREYTANDLDARHGLVTEAFGVAQSLDETRDWLDWTVASYRELARLYQPPYGDYALELKASGEVIGSVGLVPSVVPWDVLAGSEADKPPLLTPEFGLYWAVLPAHQRQGYASEAVRAFVAHLFDVVQARRLVATTEHDNHASQAVIRRLGMTLHRNPGRDPEWLQVVGVLDHPDAVQH